MGSDARSPCATRCSGMNAIDCWALVLSDTGAFFCDAFSSEPLQKAGSVSGTRHAVFASSSGLLHSLITG